MICSGSAPAGGLRCGEHTLGLQKMGTVDQTTVQAESADTRAGREGGTDLLGLRDFGRRGCERGVQRGHLRGMDRELANESGAA